ncbi:MAG: alpha/beta hydrolase-fold protein [Propionibacteriaceae bacterium]|nr:alpha/beta hydrolase-fold protein [Propionibacteriaceae bacterium]
MDISHLRGIALALPVALGLAMFAVPAGSASASCPGTSVVERITFEDSSQGATGGYSMYLPACYSEDESARYPSVYLLHGLGESDTHWLLMGVQAAADLAIARGDIAPMILVMADGGPSYEPGRDGVSFDDYVLDELVPRVDAAYRTIPSRDGRAVGGISRGGGRALAITAKAPDMFTAVGGHSPKVEDAEILAPALARAGARVWLDVGDGDYLHDGSITLAALLRATGAPVELHEWPGIHESAYWMSHVGHYLAYYDESFRLARAQS